MTIKKYGDKTKLCYIDTVSLIVSVKLEDAYADFAESWEITTHRENKEVIGNKEM